MNWQRHLLVSWGYLELGMFDDAEQALEQIRAEDKTQSEVHHAALVISLAAENWDTAVAVAADLVKAEPKNPTTWILLAHAVRHAGNVEQMETVPLKARKWPPRDPLILFRLACCASVTGRKEEGKLRLGNAIDLDESFRRLALGNGRSSASVGLAYPNAIKDIFAAPCFALPTMLYILLGETHRDGEHHEHGFLGNA